MITLPTGSNTQGTVRQVSSDSVVVGMLGPRMNSGTPGLSNQAAVWTPNGSGGHTLTTLAAVPSGAEGINRAGTLIVGKSGGVAVYWQKQPGGGWSAPITLPGGCTDGRAVDDSSRIAAVGCAGGTGAVFVPPYSSATMIRLGGLGADTNGVNIKAATIEAMSPSGNWIVGVIGGQGSYWRPF